MGGSAGKTVFGFWNRGWALGLVSVFMVSSIAGFWLGNFVDREADGAACADVLLEYYALPVAKPLPLDERQALIDEHPNCFSSG